jgi:hypothetical protein
LVSAASTMRTASSVSMPAPATTAAYSAAARRARSRPCSPDAETNEPAGPRV